MRKKIGIQLYSFRFYKTHSDRMETRVPLQHTHVSLYHYSVRSASMSIRYLYGVIIAREQSTNTFLSIFFRQYNNTQVSPKNYRRTPYTIISINSLLAF